MALFLSLGIFTVLFDMYSNIARCSIDGRMTCMYTYLTTMLVHKLHPRRTSNGQSDVRSASGGSDFRRAKNRSPSRREINMESRADGCTAKRVIFRTRGNFSRAELVLRLRRSREKHGNATRYVVANFVTGRDNAIDRGAILEVSKRRSTVRRTRGPIIVVREKPQNDYIAI